MNHLVAFYIKELILSSVRKAYCFTANVYFSDVEIKQLL
jgi:hypothetical protein